MQQYLQGLQPIRLVTDADVFEFWRDNEESQVGWQRCATDKGFASWEEWRRTYFEAFRLKEREWALYRVIEPLMTVPGFRGGPFHSWITRHYKPDFRTPTFAQLAEWLKTRENSGVQSLKAHFPAQTIITGVLTETGIVIVEGTHRCAALAMAAAEGLRIETELLIALGNELSNDASLFASIVGGHSKGEPAIRP